MASDEAGPDGSGAQIDASAAEMRRHLDVVAARLHADIAILAGRIAAAGDRLSAEMRAGFKTVDRRLERLEDRLFSDERR